MEPSRLVPCRLKEKGSGGLPSLLYSSRAGKSRSHNGIRITFVSSQSVSSYIVDNGSSGRVPSFCRGFREMQFEMDKADGCNRGGGGGFQT
ncbi:hypothetical protein IG631_21278 [Alternaria alternata]|nr:hypothetical protein IG631_21278 [Alternaria alternata]